MQVGCSKSVNVELWNNSDFSLFTFIELEVDKPDGTFCTPEELRSLKCFTLGFKESFVDSKIRKIFRLEFKPDTACIANVLMKVFVCDEKRITDPILVASSAVQAIGEFPMLRIMDLRNSKIPTNILWDSFEVNRFNSEIEKPLTSAELRFNEI